MISGFFLQGIGGTQNVICVSEEENCRDGVCIAR